MFHALVAYTVLFSFVDMQGNSEDWIRVNDGKAPVFMCHVCNPAWAALKGGSAI